jgi:phenylpropionate dioxygenase-like ring-hydroxylating dioxygenase large terminal subunit
MSLRLRDEIAYGWNSGPKLYYMPQSPGLNDPLLLNEWFAVAWSSSLLENKLQPVRVLGQELVLWRTNGAVHAWKDLCIHRGAKLSLGKISRSDKGECIVCPYHGWEYSPSGECVRIPAHTEQPPPSRARAETFVARDKYGMVWVCLGKPAGEIPVFPEADAPELRLIRVGPYEFHAQGPRIIENIMDMSHLPFAHGGLLGDPAKAEIGEYTVTNTAEGIVARDIPIWQPDPEGTGRPAMVHYSFWLERPFTMRFCKTLVNQRYTTLGAVTPVDAERSLLWFVLAMDYAHDVAEEELRHFQDLLASQDIPIVNSQRPELLPLDLQSELHLRSDLLAIAYRRWLRQLGIQYGTA